ncbi:unnamed protein product [Closterium sp. Naga37s-1]|nr:unnamed protein product [Closterium sp. Naga37s-1]
MFPADLTASVDDLPYLLTSARANIDSCVEGLQEFAPDALETAPGIRLRSEVTLITVTVTAAHACVPCAIDDEISASAGGISSADDDSADYPADSSADGYGYDYDSPPRRRRVAETDQSSDSGVPGWVTPGMLEHLKRIQAAHMGGRDAGDAPGVRRLLGLDGAETEDDAGGAEGAEAADASAQSDSIRRRLTDEGVDSAYSGDAGDSHESSDTLRRGLQSSSNGKLSKIGGVKVGGILDTSGFKGAYNSLLPPRINAIVAKDGSGTHKTLTAAIASAPMKGTFVIFIKKGVYVEQILFDNQGIVLVGEGMGRTIITNNKNVVGGSTTFNSATIGANKSTFTALGITVRNTAGTVGMFTALSITVHNTAGPVGQQAVTLRSEDTLSLALSLFPPPPRRQQGHDYGPGHHYPQHSRPSANKGMFTALGITVRNTAGTVGQQAVALRSEDLSAFFECEFDGNQDTLYPHSGRQYFRDCKVGGTVDFIFGKGAAVFDRPQIRLHKDDPVIITAPQNDPTYPEPKGIIIRNAVITADAGVGKAYLGRPWTNTGKAIFINCFLPKNAPQNDPTYPEPKGIIIRNAVITADAGVGKAYLGRPWTNTGKAIFINCFLPKAPPPCFPPPLSPPHSSPLSPLTRSPSERVDDVGHGHHEASYSSPCFSPPALLLVPPLLSPFLSPPLPGNPTRWVDDEIQPDGWTTWDTDTMRLARKNGVYFAEFQSTGPGARMPRASWVSPQRIVNPGRFTAEAFLGWTSKGWAGMGV